MIRAMENTIKRHLKQKAHHLKPVVLLGAQGLTEAVLAEIDVALTAHELIKIKLSGGDKAQRQNWAEQICQHHQAELIQIIGQIAIIYRPRPQDN
jgi:RNA-binding protein